jgi:hypothetical protein
MYTLSQCFTKHICNVRRKPIIAAKSVELPGRSLARLQRL